jgi:hypothetical protein
VGALVTINGRYVGASPVTVRDLEIGRHDVQVARPGFVPYQAAVTLSPQSPSRIMTVALRAGAAVPGAADPRVVAPVAFGSLFVDSRPRGARVTLDGRPIGVTPMRIAELPAGSHRVTIALAGYQVISTTRDVRAGQDDRLAVTLERIAVPAPVPPDRRR